MATKVLDSWALIAFFEDEPAAEEVEKLLVKAEAGTHKLLLSVVNWGEIYYNTMRKVSQEAAEQKAREIAGLTIELVPVDDRSASGASGRDLQSHEETVLCRRLRRRAGQTPQRRTGHRRPRVQGGRRRNQDRLAEVNTTRGNKAWHNQNFPMSILLCTLYSEDWVGTSGSFTRGNRLRGVRVGQGTVQLEIAKFRERGFPDKEPVRSALMDAAKKKYGGSLKGDPWNRKEKTLMVGD